MGSAGTVSVDVIANAQSIPSAIIAQLNAASAQFKTVATKMAATMAPMGSAITKGITKPLKQASIAGSQTYGWMKDIGRIVQGIFISQILYRGILQPIQEAVKELWQFNMELERTELSFKFLLKATEDLAEGTEKIADNLMKTLKIIAAQTPFIMSTVTSATQTLLALGFKEQQLKPLLILMADLSAATGGASDQMSRLAEALGKVQQRGRMTMREFKLFVSAKVPIMDILEKELGFEGLPTRMAIPAGTILPAILRYIMRFKGAAAEMEQSMTGLLSSIHDYFLFISNDIFEGFFDAIKERLSGLRARLADLWEVFDQFGLEGLIADVFPPEIALSIWQLIHLLQELGRTIGNALEATAPFRQELIKLVLIVNNWLNTGFLIFGKVIEYVTKAASKLSIITKILASALIGLAVASTVSMSITLLAKSFGFVSVAARIAFRNIGLVVGALTALALMIPKVRNWFTNLGNRILKIFGIEIPQSIMAARAAISDVDSDLGDIDWQQFIDAFSDTGDEAEEAADKIKKFLLPFDEIYSLAEEKIDIPALVDGLGDLSDFEFPDIEVPELDTIEESFGNMEINFSDTLDKLKNIWGIFWKGLVDIAKLIGPKIWPTIIETLPRVVKTAFSFVWLIIKEWYTRILPAWGKTLISFWLKIFQTLPTLIWPILKTVLSLTLATLQTLTITIPKGIQTLSMVIQGLLQSITTYGVDRVGQLGILLAGMFLKMGFHLANIVTVVGQSIGGSLGSAIFNSALGGLGTIGQEIINLILTSIMEAFQHLGFGRIAFVDEVIEQLDLYKANSSKQISSWVQEQTAKDTKYWTEGVNEYVAEQAEAIGAIAVDMGAVLALEAAKFTTVATPIFEGIGNDVMALWEGTVTDLGDVWSPAMEDIGTVWSEWFTTSGKPIWEDFGSELKNDIWIPALEGVSKDTATWLEDDFNPIWADFGTDMNTIWGDTMVDIKTIITDSKEGITTEFGDLMGAIVGEMEEPVKEITDSATAIVTAIEDTKLPIETAMSENKDIIITAMEDVVEPVTEAAIDAAQGYNEEWKGIIDEDLRETFKKIAARLLEQKPDIVTAASNIAKASVAAMDTEFSNFHPSITVDVNYNIPNIPGVSSSSTSGPSQPNATGSSSTRPKKFGYGAIVTRPTMAEVGEAGNTEGVFPLNKTSMKPFADMIGNLINSTGSPNIADDYVLIPVNKRELERELYVISKQEQFRRGKY